MVKADAYGAGAVEVAKTLQDHRVDYLAVAVGWDLSLKQVRKLCRMSIENSFLIPARKQVLRDWFKSAWRQFEAD